MEEIALVPCPICDSRFADCKRCGGTGTIEVVKRPDLPPINGRLGPDVTMPKEG